MSLGKLCQVRVTALALLWLGLMLTGLSPQPQIAEESHPIDVEVFVRKGCSHCDAAKQFLEKLQERQPNVHIVVRDVGNDALALKRLRGLASQLGIKTLGVPSFYVRGELIIGYSSEDTTGARIGKLLGRPPPDTTTSSQLDACALDSNESCVRESARTGHGPEGVFFPGLGYRTLSDLGLPFFTVLLGLVDGFNPCAMWVLLFLLSLLATLRDRKKMFLLAGSFVATSGLVYFAFMAAWLNVFLIFGYSRLIQVVLGGVATVMGVVNIKDVWAFGRGPSLHIADSAKPGLYARLRGIIQADNMKGGLVGIITLAVVVNFIELACTVGFPALYTKILTLHPLDPWAYYAYLGLYKAS